MSKAVGDKQKLMRAQRQLLIPREMEDLPGRRWTLPLPCDAGTWGSGSGRGCGIVVKLTSAGCLVELPGSVQRWLDLASVSPIQSTGYSLSCIGNGSAETKSTDVNVVPSNSVQILSFSASPNIIDPGEIVQLEWETQGATACTIDPEPGPVSVPDGNASQQPVVTTDYMLTCVGFVSTVSMRQIVRVRIEWSTARPEPSPRLDHTMTYDSLLKNTAIANLTTLVDQAKSGPIRVPEMPYDDYVLWLSLLKRGLSARGLNEDLARFRVVEGSSSSRKHRAVVWVWRIYRDVEKLSLVRALWCISHYIARAALKRLM